MMALAILLFFWTFHCYTISIIKADIDLSQLTTNQIQIWHKSISQINNITQNLSIRIINSNDEIEIPIYNNHDGIIQRNRHLFKQNINKRVDLYVYENQINSSISSNIYDPCHGRLSSRHVQPDIAGIYVYTGNQVSYGFGIIIIKLIKSFQWFNGTKSYLFNEKTNLKNGTQLILAFETLIYYNSNSDLIFYNKKINDIIQQANITINNNNNNNLETFISIENLICKQHQNIFDDELRLLTFACQTKVIFKCPLRIGSTCWLENKQISNIQLNIDKYTFNSDKTITVRIDV